MPPLSGFSDNPFQSRADLVRAALALLSPLHPYKSPGCARIKIPTATAAGFDENSAQLEGFARPLWVVPLLLNDTTIDDSHLGSWIQGLTEGTDPDSSEYWGDLGDVDQRMVEMESIAFALLCGPDRFLGAMDESAKGNLARWLRQINDHKMPQNNWLWFRIFVNLALVKRLGVFREEVQGQMDKDFKTLDSFVIGEGWSSDGLWGDERKQADYYSGSFAIQFAQLLYVRFAGEDDPERAEEYRQRARDFGASFWRYFGPNGGAIPFGRSMTYRFAFAAFWPAIACAGVRLPAPLDKIGTVKGMLLRHLRWWSKHPDIFNIDGTLNIGFTYPNMFMSEAYNSPQSVYWCLKTFIVLMLPETHEFWTAPELPHPMVQPPSSSAEHPAASQPPRTQVVWPPRQILCNTPEHHFLLSSGQMTRKHHRARESKYGKLAYSSAFGFSVPAGPLLEQLAPDSTLCVSHDGGESWKLRSDPYGEETKTMRVLCKSAEEEGKVGPALTSIWRPWKYAGFTITTTLIPLMELFPGWHLRVHKLKSCQSEGGTGWMNDVQLVDSGFALDAQSSSGCFIPEVQPGHVFQEGSCQEVDSCLLKSAAGVCGIVDLTAKTVFEPGSSGGVQSRTFALRPDPNTNLVASRTFIPSLEHTISIGSSGNHKKEDSANGEELWLVSGVFAVGASAGLDHGAIHDMWARQPRVRVSTVDDDITIDVI